MKKAAIIFIIVIVFLGLGMTSYFILRKQPAEKSEVKNYNKTAPSNFILKENSAYGIRIKYDPDWEIYNWETEKNNVVPTISFYNTKGEGRGTTSLEILWGNLKDIKTKDPYYKEKSMDQLRKESIEIAEKYPQNFGKNYKIISSSDVLITNLPGYEIISTYNDKFNGEDRDFEYLDIYFRKNSDESYTIRYKALKSEFQEYLGQVEQMISSIEFF